jgi:hypothetical protein
MANSEWRMMNDTHEDKERLISLAEASEAYDVENLW